MTANDRSSIETMMMKLRNGHANRHYVPKWRLSVRASALSRRHDDIIGKDMRFSSGISRLTLHSNLAKDDKSF